MKTKSHESRSGNTDVEEAGQNPHSSEKDHIIQKDCPNEESATDNAVADPNIVDWDGPEDPANPRNWSKGRKMLHIILISLSVLYSNIATTTFAPGASELAAEFGVTNNIVATLAVTIPSLGASTGPLLFAPLSEVAGRLPIYWASSILYLGCTIGCARSTDTAMFLVFRFLCGASAASFLTSSGGTIADLLPKEERGAATAMFTAGPLLGPVLGPIIGGFVTQALGWRWTFYLVLIFAGIVTAIAMATMRETNSTTLLASKAARLRKQTGNSDLRPALAKQVQPRQLIVRALIRPLRMLCLSPIVLPMGLYTALTFGMTFLLFATFPSVFRVTYGWSVSVSGLAYLGVGVGCVIGLILFASLSDKLVGKDGGPERRLQLMIWIGPSVSIGIFWYGWTTEYAVQWMAPIIGTVFIGLGTLVITSSTQLYMIDMFGPQGAASALAAVTLVRNASGTFLALAANPLYDSLGLGWGNSVLGFIILAFAPLPVVFGKYGARLRERFPLKL
ncbi:major facilitator superfamily domain-containing protein [Talaromyces proteolyticus]|uniref:Major facilitator superfamily domain-containing protein n=1 Tax=Talaromyces proteolyticus TaxID=1131652 RepID=A0AAD4Q028_9EURO|nr:major facilitator superfamily domain-containing protein [Talaromyces proteolyticus]KAH8700399.1 major facilitator superfamily domain-containing protein [Talaromyces proteolyticus]